ncbi:hypothetical protein GWK47_040312 [Chionoecetes opilio]|uniref:Uncharacterized protein n=1 Tax=Chionoecetes opilio TaxID=41210 RepID=A0A8J5D0Z4_CHIOP|nr:hypothetical protein GWK47_040312 [Chionoecetes opilio]
MCLTVNLSSSVKLYSQNLDGFMEWRGNATKPQPPSNAGPGRRGDEKTTIGLWSSPGAKFTYERVTPLLWIDLHSSTPTVMSQVGPAGESTVSSVRRRLLASCWRRCPRRCFHRGWPQNSALWRLIDSHWQGTQRLAFVNDDLEVIFPAGSPKETSRRSPWMPFAQEFFEKASVPHPVKRQPLCQGPPR